MRNDKTDLREIRGGTVKQQRVAEREIELRRQAEQSRQLGMLLALIAVVIAALPLLLAARNAFRGRLKLLPRTLCTATPQR